jgi:periplasmic protein TonB
MSITAKAPHEASFAAVWPTPLAAGSPAAHEGLNWPARAGDGPRRALLAPIALGHVLLVWALMRSMVLTVPPPSTPTFVQVLPDTGLGASTALPPELPAPQRSAPTQPWMSVPDVVVTPAQAQASVLAPSPQPTLPAAPAEAAAAASSAAPASATLAPERAAPPERQISISEVAYLAPPVLDYPLAARRRREEGVVHVRLRVDAGGRPDQATVVRSSGHDALDRAALATVRATRFRPYTEDGVPRPFWVVMPLIFELES